MAMTLAFTEGNDYRYIGEAVGAVGKPGRRRRLAICTNRVEVLPVNERPRVSAAPSAQVDLTLQQGFSPLREKPNQLKSTFSRLIAGRLDLIAKSNFDLRGQTSRFNRLQTPDCAVACIAR